ncbi:hypothetical protein [Streptomyces sp. NPDC001658]
MPDQTAYVDQLATELRTQRPDLIRAAEDELQRLRLALGTVAAFINNPDHDHTARTALAQALNLPAPDR